MGLTLFVSDEWASKTLTSICLPKGINGEELRNNILQKHSILLGGGLGRTANTVVRVGHLSMTASSKYLVPTIRALETELALLGEPVHQGAAVKTFKGRFAG